MQHEAVKPYLTTDNSPVLAAWALLSSAGVIGLDRESFADVAELVGPMAYPAPTGPSYGEAIEQLGRAGRFRVFFKTVDGNQRVFARWDDQHHPRGPVDAIKWRKRIREVLLSRDGRKGKIECWICGRKHDPADPWTIDHLTPLGKRGKSYVANLRAACRPCNERKANLKPGQLFHRDKHTRLWFLTGWARALEAVVSPKDHKRRDHIDRRLSQARGRLEKLHHRGDPTPRPRFTMPDTKLDPTAAERIAAMQAHLEVKKAGYAGMSVHTGHLCDRRDEPDAIPIQKNSLLGVPEPRRCTKCESLKLAWLDKQAGDVECRECGELQP